MNQGDIDRLLGVASALYLREMQGFPEILAEEERLRACLAQLDGQVLRARTELARSPTMRSVGADHLWQGWEAETRRRLNGELAQVMARKLARLDRVRYAFGRLQALRSLSRKEVGDLRARRAGLRDERLLAAECLTREVP